MRMAPFAHCLIAWSLVGKDLEVWPWEEVWPHGRGCVPGVGFVVSKVKDIPS